MSRSQEYYSAAACLFEIIILSNECDRITIRPFGTFLLLLGRALLEKLSIRRTWKAEGSRCFSNVTFLDRNETFCELNFKCWWNSSIFLFFFDDVKSESLFIINVFSVKFMFVRINYKEQFIHFYWFIVFQNYE